jgi:hypothetical protein
LLADKMFRNLGRRFCLGASALVKQVESPHPSVIQLRTEQANR